MTTAFVTGGSKGIGAAIVRAFSARGNVAFSYCENERAARAIESELGAGAFAIHCDVTSSLSVSAAAESVIQRFGVPDVIVNCAGVSSIGLLQDVTDEEWRRVFSVNCDGAFYVTRAFLPHMLERKRGSIINVASVWGVSGASCEVAYSASKAALLGFTRALAREVAPSGITVNAVAPGAVDTDMMKCYSPEDMRAICDEIPMGRLATPDEIAAAVVFLADQRYVTGQTLTIDGGFI